MEEIKSKLTPLNFLRLSALGNLITGIIKLLTGFYSNSYFLITYGALGILMFMGKLTTVFGERFEENKARSTFKEKRAAALTIFILGATFFSFSLYNFTYEVTISYSLINAILIAACAFFKLVLGIYGVAKYSSIKYSSLYISKLINLTDAAISITITQSAILSAKNLPDTYVYDGILGMLTGAAIIVTSLILLLNTLSKKNE